MTKNVPQNDDPNGSHRRTVFRGSFSPDKVDEAIKEPTSVHRVNSTTNNVRPRPHAAWTTGVLSSLGKS